jgi:hypothetical protein
MLVYPVEFLENPFAPSHELEELAPEAVISSGDDARWTVGGLRGFNFGDQESQRWIRLQREQVHPPSRLARYFLLPDPLGRHQRSPHLLDHQVGDHLGQLVARDIQPGPILPHTRWRDHGRHGLSDSGLDVASVRHWL